MKLHLKTIFYVFIILALSILAAVGLIVTAPEPVPVQKKLAPPIIDAFKVLDKSLTPEVQLTGRLQPVHKVKLKFALSGRVSARLVEPGQKVHVGQVLVKLDAGDYADALVQAKAQHTLERAGIQRDKRLLMLAQRNSALQAKEVARLSKLGKGRLVSRSLLGQARQKLYQLRSEEARLRFSVETAEARLKLRRAAIDRARRNLERTSLSAPFAGVVNAVYVEKGDYVSPATLVVELVSADQVELVLHVRSRLASVLRLGRTVEVRVGGRKYDGRIVALQADPDASTFTHQLRIALPRGVARPGTVARVRLKLDPLSNVVAVPASAVLQEHGTAYVMVLKADKRVKRRKVRLGRRIRNWQVIEQGLSVGETVVGRDVASLKDGQIVNPKTTIYSYQ